MNSEMSKRAEIVMTSEPAIEDNVCIYTGPSQPRCNL
jgi:hypothetical protein